MRYGPPDVRLATRDDLPALVALEEAAFPDSSWGEESLARQVTNRDCLVLVARLSGLSVPAAYGAFRVLVDDDPDDAGGSGEAELLRLATDPAHRGLGLGGLVLATGLGRLGRQGTALVHLEVAAGNRPALSLYRRAGFEEVGRRPRYYRDGSDALLLTLELSRRMPPADPVKKR